VAASESVRAMARRSDPIGPVSFMLFTDFVVGELGVSFCTHDISLGTDGDQSVDVLLDGDENLSGHVSALLGAWGLILNMNTSSALFDEHLGELHDGSQTTMAGISIGDDGSQEIGVGEFGSLGLGDGEAFLALLPVVEELGEPQMIDLVGDGGLRVWINQCKHLVSERG
jgi:hypothetical protein